MSAMAGRINAEERRLIDAALAEGRVTRVQAQVRAAPRVSGSVTEVAPPAVPCDVPRGDPLVPGRGALTPVSIEALLHWAFAREKARIDFSESDGSARGFGYVSSTACIIAHEQLGCRITGGGSSAPHVDAEVVASAVASLPMSCGGRQMALLIAEAARAGQRPDWGQRLGPCRCAPIDWRMTKRGRFARREYYRGPGQWSQTMLGRDDGYHCAVTFTGTPREHAAARRRWLLWWGALLELRAVLGCEGVLSGWSLTSVMPPRAPWATGVRSEIS